WCCATESSTDRAQGSTSRPLAARCTSTPPPTPHDEQPPTAPPASTTSPKKTAPSAVKKPSPPSAGAQTSASPRHHPSPPRSFTNHRPHDPDKTVSRDEICLVLIGGGRFS